MRKTLLSMVIFIAVFFILYSCQNIPTAPSIIPRDPTGTTKPSVSGYSADGIYISVDKIPALLPLAVPDYVKIRLSIPGVENIRANDLRVFEDNKEQGFVLYKESTTRNKLDIAIILDVTGSMWNAINGVKNSIINFANMLQSSGLDVRVAVIPYDDNAYSKQWNGDPRFDPPYLGLTIPENVESYVSKLSAAGGGEDPENPYNAIMFAATALEWRPGSQRSMILITDAPAHYKNDGSTEHDAKFTKADMLPYLVGYFTIHGAFVPSWWYSSSTTDFSDQDDPRELCQKTAGIIKYTDSYGNVDLTDLGIVEYVESSYIIAFESDSSADAHTVEVFYESGSTKKYAKIENAAY